MSLTVRIGYACLLSCGPQRQFLMDAQRKLHAKVDVDVAFEDVKSVLHID